MSLLHSIWDTTVEDKESLEEEFLAWLREHGYPEGSLFRGPSFHLKLGRKSREAFRRHFHHAAFDESHELSCYTDLAILDLESNQYAALVEFRTHLDDDDEKRLATVFQAILDELPAAPAIYLVVPGAQYGFIIYQMQDGGFWSEIPATQFPGYSAMTKNFATARLSNEELHHTRGLSRFTYACRALAILIAALTIYSFIRVGPLTTVHILLLIIAALLFLGPEALGYQTAAKHRPKILRFR